MKLPRDLSGRDLAASLCLRWEYAEINQEGSQIILQTQMPFPHRLSIPDHRVLRIGTLNSILRAVAIHKGVDRQEIVRSI